MWFASIFLVYVLNDDLIILRKCTRVVRLHEACTPPSPYPPTIPFALAVNKSPAVYIHARSTDFEEKI